MNGQTKLEVIIGGDKYTLEGAEPEEYFQKLARYIDKKISETKRFKRTANTLDLYAMNIIINIADSLFKDKELLSEENLILKTRLSDAAAEYNNVKKELDGFIDAFDKPKVYKVKTENN